MQAPVAANAAPAKLRVQAILREASALQWLPMTSDDVARCARRVKVMLMQCQRELLPLTLVAVAQALGHDAATKHDAHLAQVRMYMHARLYWGAFVGSIRRVELSGQTPKISALQF